MNLGIFLSDPLGSHTRMIGVHCPAQLLCEFWGLELRPLGFTTSTLPTEGRLWPRIMFCIPFLIHRRLISCFIQTFNLFWNEYHSNLYYEIKKKSLRTHKWSVLFWNICEHNIVPYNFFFVSFYQKNINVGRKSIYTVTFLKSAMGAQEIVHLM